MNFPLFLLLLVHSFKPLWLVKVLSIFKICWDLYYDLTYGLFWRMFQVYLRKTYSLLLQNVIGPFDSIKVTCRQHISSVQSTHSAVSDSLPLHELQRTRPPCPSPTPRVHWNSHPSSQWCHPAISSSVVSFSFCPQSLPASESFPMSQLFAWGGQSTGVSALASFLPKNTIIVGYCLLIYSVTICLLL